MPAMFLTLARRGPAPLVPLTAERYVSVSIALKESLDACVAEEARLRREHTTDPARLSRLLAEARAAHGRRESGIFASASTSATAFGDFLLVPANRKAAKDLLAREPRLQGALAHLEQKRAKSLPLGGAR